MPRIILASQSPRRRQLLGQLGLEGCVMVGAGGGARDAPARPPEGSRAYICRRKARAARDRADDGEAIIIAADTMVFLDGLRLGKPHSREEARAMLRSLSGREHQVCTGVTVCRGDRVDTRCESTAVHFRPLTDREIESYIDTGEPMDKAGAYGIQGLGALFVEGIRGDYCNVMGLPLFLLGRMLSDFGVDLLGGGEEP